MSAIRLGLVMDHTQQIAQEDCNRGLADSRNINAGFLFDVVLEVLLDSQWTLLQGIIEMYLFPPYLLTTEVDAYCAVANQFRRYLIRVARNTTNDDLADGKTLL